MYPTPSSPKKKKLTPDTKICAYYGAAESKNSVSSVCYADFSIWKKNGRGYFHFFILDHISQMYNTEEGNARLSFMIYDA